MTAEHPLTIAERLVRRYVWTLDRGRYDEWVALFNAQARYRIVPRENLQAGLPACLTYCAGRPMIADRVAALAQGAKYDIGMPRHFLGPVRSSLFFQTGWRGINDASARHRSFIPPMEAKIAIAALIAIFAIVSGAVQGLSSPDADRVDLDPSVRSSAH